MLMKKLMMIICLILLTVGCSSKEYDQQMGLGKKAMENGQYKEAVRYFENAAKEKSTDEIQQYIRLANQMQDSEEALKDGKYEVAIVSAEKVMQIKEEKVIKGKAEQLIKEAKDLQEKTKSTEKQIQVGKELLHEKKYEEAYQTFKEIADEKVSQQFVKDATNFMNEAVTAKKQYEDEQEKVRKEQAELEKKNQEQQKIKEEEKRKQEQLKEKEEEKKKADTSVSNISTAEAEKLVRKQYNVPANTIVEYDHDNEKGDYVIHVYNVIVNGDEGHTATVGWFDVNPKTKRISKSF
ncbi:hypothetical protein CBR56_04785 [Bacillus thuringiensis]|uniref:hypothetical protein n=1 Tax=Bacillus tropicus TaxID=2026188 RepID=UPI000B451292|nr:hypothetical protein [Bacillus tropicus]OTX86786.1 hypothetical protein BK728_08730 [Bacillus thuringiensis serovar chanpaisis]PNK32994.1 hypothetical protein CBR56_04785 [Bacillus thuringiensis]